MQILKESIKEKIVKEGIKLFKIKGFQETSMKDIANAANISTGNIYRYFINKQKLIDEMLVKIENEISDFSKSLPSNCKDINHDELYELLVEKILQWHSSYKDELIIMINCKDRLQYLNFKDKIVKIVTDKIIELSKSLKNNNMNNVLAGSIANSMFDGLIYIVVNNKDDKEEMKKNLQAYIKIMISGLEKRIEEV